MSLSAFSRTSTCKTVVDDKRTQSSGIEVALFWGNSLLGVERTASSADFSLYSDEKNAIAKLLAPCMSYLPSSTFELFSEKDGRFYLHSPQGEKTSRQGQIIENEFVHLDTDAPICVEFGPFTLQVRRFGFSPPQQATPFDFRFFKILLCTLAVHFALVTALHASPKPPQENYKPWVTGLIVTLQKKERKMILFGCRKNRKKPALVSTTTEASGECGCAQNPEHERWQKKIDSRLRHMGLLPRLGNANFTMLTAGERFESELKVAEKTEKPKAFHVDLPGIGRQAVILRNPLSRGEIQQSIRRSLPKMKLCYENSLRSNERLEGKIVFSWTISSSGHVEKAKNKSSSLNDKNVASCLLKHIQELEFNEPRGGGRVEVVYPFVF
ncbi:MAG: AgmX/PglI C-terminal domain-containing protein [Deltaproteobacteria bacterium]|nr:AgmX/PglI C-terminal domain-containing protein [Deltaproteobacteria bacterium]